ncbi:hypothetical protein ACIB24_01810 [Spongisporangium articulatum]|uniref:Nucleotidyl transferase n=1 Tax=Spongisporangium articulatum TaxID=3362603 RepID=A0ABW8AHF9_9ACTN
MSDPLIGADRIRSLLVELGERLDARGLEARLFLVGGAAMALAYSRDRVTRDLDAVFEPKREIYDEAERMAQEHRLPDNWLNDAVKGLLPPNVPPTEGSASFGTRGLHVGVASAEYLFVMKAVAARHETDGADLQLLADVLGITSTEAALDLVERYYGSARVPPKTQILLEDLLGG